MKKQILLLSLFLSFSIACSKDQDKKEEAMENLRQETARFQAEEENNLKERKSIIETKTAEKKTEKKSAPSSYETKRLKFVRENNLPKKYLDMDIDLSKSDQTNGKKLFKKHCASCHGIDAKGNTPAGKFLKPPASNLTLVAKNTIVAENYLFWAISEGGAKMKSSMPAFKKKLTENERKEIIKYLKNL